MASIDDLPPPPKSSIDDLPPPPQEIKSSSGPSLSQQGKSSIQGFGKLASFGQIPNLQALTEKAVDSLTPESSSDKNLESQGFEIHPIEKSLPEIRKDYVNYDTEQKNAAPYSYLGGAISGGAANAVASGGSLPLSQASPLTQAIAGGAIQSALNAGPKEFESGELNLKERGEQALAGAKYGLGAATAGAVISKAAQELPALAQSTAFKSLGPYVKQVKDTFKKDVPGDLGSEAKEIGQFVLDNKIVQAGDDIHSIYDKAQNVRQQVGDQIGQTYDQALSIAQSQGQDMAFNPKQLGKEFLDDYAQSMRGKAGGDQSVSAVKQEVKNFMQMPAQANIKDVHDFRAGLDDLIYDAKSNQNSPAVNSLKEFRSYITDKMNQHIDQVSQASGSDIGSQLQDLNRQYSLASSATQIARNKVIHETAKSMVGLRDAGLGSAGAIIAEGAVHNPVEATAIGLGTMAASKVARTYGNPILAKGLESAGASASSLEESLQSLSPSELGSISGQIQNVKQSTPFQRRMEGTKK